MFGFGHFNNFIYIKKFKVLTLWQILQMHVNMFEGEISHPARFFPLLVQLRISFLFNLKKIKKKAPYFASTRINRKIHRNCFSIH